MLAQAVIAAESVPAFNRSLVDGFALVAADTNGATDFAPARLRSDTIAAGAFRGTRLLPVKLQNFTGAPLPEGADSIIKRRSDEIAGCRATPRL